MIKLFGIPNCDTVKKARAFLETHKLDYTFIDFKKSSPTPDDLKKWSEAFGGWPVNTKGTTYKKFKDKFESLGEAQKGIFLSQNTSMIKRPILEKSGKVLYFGFDEENYKKICL